MWTYSNLLHGNDPEEIKEKKKETGLTIHAGMLEFPM